MTYTPHVWSRHDKLDSAALNDLEQAVANFSVSQLSASDSTIAPIITSGTQTVAAVNSTIDARLGGNSANLVKNMRVLVDQQAGATDAAKLAAACSAASTFGGVVELPDRTVDVGNGFSLSGYSCGIVGRGAGMSSSNVATRSVITASTQTGPVLDFTGFKYPNQFQGRIEFGNFAIVGSGVADPTKVKAGIKAATPTTAISSIYLHDIAISGTGGPCLDAGVCYLSDFERITMVTPVGAKANDVPYFIARGANGNRYNGLGFRSMLASGDTGPSGALVLTDDGNGLPTNAAVFAGTWFENLHAPTNGCFIAHQGNAVTFSDTMFYDCAKESGATGTAYVRYTSPTTNYGGNSWRGPVPGKGTSATSIDLGIDLRQSGNFIQGRKGYNGSNVQLSAGVTATTAILAGAENAASGAAFIDNSGSNTNVLIDYVANTISYGKFAQAARSSGDGGAGPMFSDPADATKGAFWLGSSGARVQVTGGVFYTNAGTSNTYTFRDNASTAGRAFQFILGAPGTSGPGVVLPNSGTLPAAASYLRGKVCLVYGDGATTADQMFVCRLNASGAYEWKQITT